MVAPGAVTFREVTDVQKNLCMVAIPVVQGAVFVRVDAFLGERHQEEVCALATRQAIALLAYLPK
ncbi:hypothetical protein QV65_20970 [Rhodococcus erythropolis]|nr:hypothetical protein QV65_20970 [Rhodococcus erythropolis]